MFLYNIQKWWEDYAQDTIFSSGYILIDLLRLFSIPLALLAFPGIYIGLGIKITFSIILISVITLGAVVYCLTKDTRTSYQSMILSAIFLTIGYIFVILAETLLILYWTCAISFLILQDWCHSISFTQQNSENFLDYVFDKSHSIIKKIIEIFSYASVIIGSFIASYKNWNNINYENLKKEKISFVNHYSIQEQLYNNSFTQKIARSNWDNSLEQSGSLLEQIWSVIQNLKWIQNIFQSLENLKALIEYLGYVMIIFIIFSYLVPIITKWIGNIIDE